MYERILNLVYSRMMNIIYKNNLIKVKTPELIRFLKFDFEPVSLRVLKMYNMLIFKINNYQILWRIDHDEINRFMTLRTSGS